MENWYLIRTKTGGERIAHQHLRHVVERSLLPLATTRLRQRGRVFQRVAPIFPSYLFAYFSLGRAGRQIQYTPGVRNIVRFGEEAAIVPNLVIDGLLSRCSAGPIELVPPELSRGSQIRIVDGPLKAFQGVFDGYLNGAERVSVLLSVMNAQRRVVMPASMVIAAE